MRLLQAQILASRTRVLVRITFELSGRRRQDARPGLAKMYRVPPDRAWWPAVGAPLERGVRQLCLARNHERLEPALYCFSCVSRLGVEAQLGLRGVRVYDVYQLLKQ